MFFELFEIVCRCRLFPRYLQGLERILSGRLIKLSLFFSIVYEYLIEFRGYSNYSYSQGNCALKNSALLAISFLIFDLIDEK